MSYLSRVQYPGTGTTALYSIPFAYISKAYIEVRVGGSLLTEGVGFTWQSATSILLTAGNLPSGTVLDIRRATPKNAKLVDFQDGSVLTEASLDLSNDQVFQLVQETVDDMADRLAVQADGTVDGQNRRIKNVAEPVQQTDAATKEYVDTAPTIAAVAAAVSAEAAAVSASQAAVVGDFIANVAATLDMDQYAPKTGGGASGTWPIGVTGNAGSATTAANLVGRAQIGSSGTPSHNFTMTAEADDGTLKVARGNAGATTQDVMTFDALGKVSFPQGRAANAQMSMVRVAVSAGLGSTYTCIRRFSTLITHTGSDITYTDSATLGGSFTINTAGVYSVVYGDCFTTANAWMGLSANTATPSTQINGLPVSEILAVGNTVAANLSGNVSWVGTLAAGAVVRAHCQAGLSAGSGSNPYLTIVRIA